MKADPIFGQFAEMLVTPFFKLERAEDLSGAGLEPYYRLAERDSVICCVLDESDQLIFVKQYRPSLETVTLETPAGAIEAGEHPLDAARRELREETGVVCPLLPLGQYFRLMMNRVTSREHLFFGMFPVYLSDGAQESAIEICRVPRAEILKLAFAGVYQQVAGLGLLTLAGAALRVDIWRDPVEKIQDAFHRTDGVDWPSDSA
jgi:8-oxo-dGTP pyrophosphatase MutT (NUDIX family)